VVNAARPCAGVDVVAEVTMRALAACILAMLLISCTDTERTNREQSNLGYAGTRNPIVLVPGFLGFDDLLGVEHYFHGIPEALEQAGAHVHVALTPQAASAETIGEELIVQLDAFAEEDGIERFNLIGHSAGSLAARYVASVRPDRVASVTAIAGPHKGTPVADFVLSDSFGDLDNALVQGVADLLGLVSGSPYPNDVDAALGSMSLDGATAFTAEHPAAVATDCGDGQAVVDGIPYYSWGGVGALTNPLDLSDLLLAGLGALIDEPNDGLVGRCSTHLGRVIRDDYKANHMDEVDLLFGMVSMTGPSPASLFRQQANRLKLAGL